MYRSDKEEGSEIPSLPGSCLPLPAALRSVFFLQPGMVRKVIATLHGLV